MISSKTGAGHVDPLCETPIDFTDGAPQTIDPTAVGLVKLLAKRKAIEMLPLVDLMTNPATCAPNTRCCAWLAHCDAHSDGQATNASHSVMGVLGIRQGVLEGLLGGCPFAPSI